MTEQRLVISRANWYRGRHNSMLRQKGTGEMCCLGFEALRRGHTPTEITGVTYPANIREIDEEQWSGLVELYSADYHTDTSLCRDMATCNDDQNINDEQREKTIIELFAQLDPPVIVEFVP